MNKINTIFFDLDGTLVNSVSDIADSANYALIKHGHKPYEEERYKHFTGRGVDVLIKNVAPSALESEIADIKASYLSYYAEHSRDKTVVYDGVLDAINTLKSNGYRLAVLSNKPDADTKDVVFSFFGENVFDYVSGKRVRFPVKPDPALLCHIMEEMNVLPSSCAFVGDTEIDYETGKNAGCFPVSVSWGFRTKQELLMLKLPNIIDFPNDLHILLTTYKSSL